MTIFPGTPHKDWLDMPLGDIAELVAGRNEVHDLRANDDKRHGWDALMPFFGRKV